MHNHRCSKHSRIGPNGNGLTLDTVVELTPNPKTRLLALESQIKPLDVTCLLIATALTLALCVLTGYYTYEFGLDYSPLLFFLLIITIIMLAINAGIAIRNYYRLKAIHDEMHEDYAVSS
ncbi:hypothetical protein WR25_13078 [Diploscapter pachys]|uniref:Uncharacterized protein n=1 Tax=Diploscapter pachys TaxID=2018661 RepID=A0A2A2JQS9_9BILA|nr:hypothetical protein WR25_13078 [Diploscapter pachys]